MGAKYIFSGHESFPCKSLWLKKGYDFVKSGNNFNSPNAVVHLGVGKNMVSSIRFWMRSFDLIEDDQLTWLSNYLFDEICGKDKYLEDLASLWLLHFTLIQHNEASLYRMVFCGLQRERSTFDRDQVINYVKLKMIEAGKSNQFNANTVKKDVAVLLQNYTLPRKPQSNEDYSSLMMDLDLLRQNQDGKCYYFNVEGKRQVSESIFLYALLCLKEEGDNTIPYETIQENIGLAFCMQDHETIDMLKRLSFDYSKYMTYNDVAGIRQIQFIETLDPQFVLDQYYDTNI